MELDEAIRTADLFAVSDDALADFFRNAPPVWQQVRKIFVLDSCYAGGFLGDDLTPDTGDLETLPDDNYVLIASAEEGKFAQTVGPLLEGHVQDGITFELGTGIWTNVFLPLLEARVPFDQLDSLTDTAAQGLTGFQGFLVGVKADTETGDSWPFDFNEVQSHVTVGSGISAQGSIIEAAPVVVPEPAALLQLSCGAMVVALLRRRRTGC